MDIKTKAVLQNMMASTLSGGWHHDNIKERFLTMRMERDYGEECYFGSPPLQDIFDHLIAYDAIDNKDISTEYCGQGGIIPRLNIRLSPTFSLHMERAPRGLYVKVNESVPMRLTPSNAANVVIWVIRQKQNLDLYLQEWEELFKETVKKQKKEHMAFLAIKAIFTEAMRDYPKLKYEIVEQQRKARIKVEIPNSNLGVCIDGWWKSYQQRLPQQIESLKLLIDTHRNSAIKTFFTTRYIH